MPDAPTVLELDTPHGLARAHVHPPPPGTAPVAALVLGHGAGGSITAPDLQAVTGVAVAAGVTTALVEQPYRVAGRRSAPAASTLDTAWTSVVQQLRDGGALDGLPLITGGRSSGARVACRTAQELGAIGVLCLAFPLHPPRRSPDAEQKTRLGELDAVTVATLVIQGVNDRFGMPPHGRQRTVVEVAGDHGLKSDVGAVAGAAMAWLKELVR
ncbi:MAG TPA: alpha/beta family hydrolase [Baekduia sp.]|nr:alpha/beta family hydrolase [Baekduia sp.]